MDESSSQHTPLSETLLYALAALVLGLTALGALSMVAAVAGGVIASGTAVWGARRRSREEAARRRAADALIVYVPGDRVPEPLRWRAVELTSPAHRRQLARQVADLARLAVRRRLFTAMPLFVSTLRPNRRLFEALAMRLRELDRAVSPRGIVLLEALLRDGASSPLYRPACAAELECALRRVRGAIEPDGQSGWRQPHGGLGGSS